MWGGGIVHVGLELGGVISQLLQERVVPRRGGLPGGAGKSTVAMSQQERTSGESYAPDHLALLQAYAENTLSRSATKPPHQKDAVPTCTHLRRLGSRYVLTA